MNPNTIVINKAQDIHIEDYALKSAYYNYFLSGNAVSAQNIIHSNPQLRSKVLDSDMLNAVINGILEVQTETYDNGVGYLYDRKEEFQLNVDNLLLLGEFDNLREYYINNMVYYDGQLYFCVDNPPIGTLPIDTAYWLYIGLRGEKGYLSLGLKYRGDWNTSTSYNELDYVIYKNTLYVAYEDNVNKNPEISTAEWKVGLAIRKSKVYLSATPPLDIQTGDIWFISEGSDFVFPSSTTYPSEDIYPFG